MLAYYSARVCVVLFFVGCVCAAMAEDLRRGCAVVLLWRQESVGVWLLLLLVESVAALSNLLLFVLAPV